MDIARPKLTILLTHTYCLTQTFSTVATLSEVGTLMLEFNSLTRHTGDPAFERVAARAMELLYEVTGYPQPKPQMPSSWS
jgi:hypothetical protein